MNGMQTTEAEELSAYTARTRAHDLAEIALDSWNRGEITDEWFLLMVEEAGRRLRLRTIPLYAPECMPMEPF